MDKAQFMTRLNGKHHLRCQAPEATFVWLPGRQNGDVRMGHVAGDTIRTNLCDIEPSEIFLEHVSFDQEIQKVTATHVLENLDRTRCVRHGVR